LQTRLNRKRSSQQRNFYLNAITSSEKSVHNWGCKNCPERFATHKLRRSTYTRTPSGNPKPMLWLSLCVPNQFFLSPDVKFVLNAITTDKSQMLKALKPERSRFGFLSVWQLFEKYFTGKAFFPPFLNM